jgi:cellulose synthase/poly-beta-1,6-N-acetylglucosamine synthase-like glycosyltransferase
VVRALSGPCGVPRGLGQSHIPGPRRLESGGILESSDVAGRGVTESRDVAGRDITEWPFVGVVIATRNRPHLVRRALASVRQQDYPGPMRVVVVFDGVMPDWQLAGGGQRPVLVLENWRTPGLAGARNTGILAAGDCELVALCADDDTWAPTKLTAQVLAMRARPGALFATCGAEIEYGGRRTPRLSGLHDIGLDQLTRGRVRLPASGFIARQAALATDPGRGGIGLVAEDGPPGGAEWDLLVRAARQAPIVNVDAPLVRVLWRRTTVDPASCTDRAGALRWMAAQHPEINGRRPAAARLYSEIACWEAAAGRTRAARTWARSAVRARWYAPRSMIALAAAAGALRGRPLHALLRHLTP